MITTKSLSKNIRIQPRSLRSKANKDFTALRGGFSFGTLPRANSHPDALVISGREVRGKRFSVAQHAGYDRVLGARHP